MPLQVSKMEEFVPMMAVAMNNRRALKPLMTAVTGSINIKLNQIDRQIEDITRREDERESKLEDMNKRLDEFEQRETEPTPSL